MPVSIAYQELSQIPIKILPKSYLRLITSDIMAQTLLPRT